MTQHARWLEGVGIEIGHSPISRGGAETHFRAFLVSHSQHKPLSTANHITPHTGDTVVIASQSYVLFADCSTILVLLGHLVSRRPQ